MIEIAMLKILDFHLFSMTFLNSYFFVFHDTKFRCDSEWKHFFKAFNPMNPRFIFNGSRFSENVNFSIFHILKCSNVQKLKDFNLPLFGESTEYKIAQIRIAPHS